MAPQQQVKVLERYTVAPLPGSVLPPSTLPFTFFDVLCSALPPVERLLLYHFPISTSTFLSTYLPNLKHSLALALQFFFPLVGKIVFPTDGGGGPPELCYSDGDSVEFTVAESDDDFHDLASKSPKYVSRLYPLVPSLDLAESAVGRPVMSLQVAIFPHSGVGIGMCTDHGAADGPSTTHFLKMWASIARLGYDKAISSVGQLLPSYDRTLIIEACPNFSHNNVGGPPKVKEFRDLNTAVMATSVLTSAQFDGLSEWIFSRTSTRCSKFAIACGVAWVYVVKAKASIASCLSHSTTTNDVELLGFGANCRKRLDPPLPPEYFGNCVTACFAKKPRSDLVGSDGLAAAAVAIREAVVDLGREGVFRSIERTDSALRHRATYIGRMLPVAGSPRFGVYQVDFGWGRPRKVEMVSIDRTGAISLVENGNEAEGGIEVGIALPNDVMAEFRANFDRIKQIAC